MSKELEVLDDWLWGKINEDETDISDLEYFEKLRTAITELKAIKEAKPGKAIECLEEICNDKAIHDYILYNCLDEDFINVRNSLLKAQEQEKENVYIGKVKTLLKQKDCILRYIESEDCFAVKTILSYDWHKLTPEFVDNNIREEVKPLPTIEKIKQLKEENAEYKKALNVIIKKNVMIYALKVSKTVDDYNDLVSANEQLTEEEFDLLKKEVDKWKIESL